MRSQGNSPKNLAGYRFATSIMIGFLLPDFKIELQRLP
jgi:hypothetical protein